MKIQGDTPERNAPVTSGGNEWFDLLTLEELLAAAPSLRLIEEDGQVSLEEVASYLYKGGPHLPHSDTHTASEKDTHQAFVDKRPHRKYWKYVKQEVYLLICTSDKRYDALRSRLNLPAEASKIPLLGTVAASIGDGLCIQGEVIRGFCAVALYMVVRLGKYTYCRGGEDVTDADLRCALNAVMHGHDPTAARNLIEYFYRRISAGQPYNQHILLEYLHYAFGKIINDKVTADQAFGFKLTRGKYERDDTSERDVFAAAYMTLLIRKGWTWLDAKSEAANWLPFSYGTGERAVEDAYAAYKEEFQALPDDSLKGMLPPNTKIPSVIRRKKSKR